MKKKLSIKTYGCQMNVYDSIRMGDLLKPHGFEVVADTYSEDLDMIIFNTCHIREKAAEKVYSELDKVKKKKTIRNKNGQEMIIVVAGCTAQAEGEEVFRRAPYVDIVVGPQSYQNLPVLLEQVRREKKWAIDLEFKENDKFDLLPEHDELKGPSAFLSVQEGCDKFCHFCVVPYTRGSEYSRAVPVIHREASKLVSLGAKEINLLGQNVSAYHADIEGEQWNLGKLIKHLAKIKDLQRIRYTTSHPKDMLDSDLFAVHKDEPKLMPFLHLPVQSGSDKILKAMNRQHTGDFYFKIIDKFREYKPDMAFSSDFIVGYPGETDQDFQDTLDLVKRIGYAQCYTFKYSPRPGTPASVLENQVPEDIKSERLYILQELLAQQQLAFNQSMVGKVLPVLLQKDGKKEGQLIGKSPYMQSVFIVAPKEKEGQVVNVSITAGFQNSLAGVI
ncbi:MAG: tRNA (N6-isopentenyl adenosine(37)-C2)-methylthiotransferase MiaB [Candidatus Midichloria mitochondrii]|uniref:tRNA-2-methylthio-N(6)-dimethylallyladenosine synthase n=1 Tax=Midichloria mitochondrii (strain IricVA) TaxID=696127 RepID=F7XUR7_MIDMI|nr:tRNA (N6-isopentenyl adenosine(37)-C2)-methylthiotransferase MiaB [Candidatus Midichloria mitochondrii]AEI88416.1 tRNA-I(6)A37 thiotransferase enzyme [Candidatus Midichloria mitochondrii IricVA]MDJ1256688.1 tRNA (N6-isopentenyl adenosine(37)-C2)-methylthiotransferase MiaB [Candidatus Midichloria mitochondrii]MDJ1288502.1 tRNA (N6-isopentenyl adenosine(37)-C2)-methylthiotransferase MiaB [Candidatus Midichloria mitochondrii]MDJ1299331.1 tRNA (N6-isopentenyl adenosine(37)-C2)-methylthiotransfer